MSVEETAIEYLNGGTPLAPPVVSVPMFGRDYPLMHGARSFAGASRDGYVLVAIGHHGMEAGLFMGLSPDSARAMAAWLLSSANDVDGGAVTQ